MMNWDIRGVCWCGSAVRAVPAVRRAPLDEWAWQDGNGAVRVSVDIGKALSAVGGWEGLARIDIGAYSNTMAARELGHRYMGHDHSPVGDTTGGPAPDEVPWCHGEPMYLGVEAWVCRKTRKAECR